LKKITITTIILHNNKEALKIKNYENCLEWLECMHTAQPYVKLIFMYFECKIHVNNINYILKFYLII